MYIPSCDIRGTANENMLVAIDRLRNGISSVCIGHRLSFYTRFLFYFILLWLYLLNKIRIWIYYYRFVFSTTIELGAGWGSGLPCGGPVPPAAKLRPGMLCAHDTDRYGIGLLSVWQSNAEHRRASRIHTLEAKLNAREDGAKYIY